MTLARQGARLSLAVAGSGLLTGVVLGAGPVPANAATTDTLNTAMIQSIAVSPVYTRTGLVAVEGVQTGCQQSCARVWVSRDGGVSWHVAAGHGYASGMPLTIAVDGQGREILLAPNGSSHGFQTSTDTGDTWTTSPVIGRPTPTPSYPQSGTVAVAGGAHDALVSAAGQQPIQGSSGSYADGNFVYMPGYPSSGGHSPAFLGAVDPHSGLPFVLHCGADLSCGGAVALAAGNAFSGTPEIVPAGDYASSAAVFVWTATGVYRSTDGGSSFVPLAIDQGPAGSANAYTGFGLAPSYQQGGPVHVAYVGVLQASQNQSSQPVEGVFRSNDGGTSWQSISAGTPLVTGAQAMTVAPDGRIYAAYSAGGSGGILCTDNGQHWASCSPRGQTAGSSGGTTAAGAGTGTKPAVNAPASTRAPAEAAHGSTPVSGSASTSAAIPGAIGGGTGAHVPPAGGTSAWLWLLGALVVVVGGGGFAFRMRQRRRPA